MKARNLAVESNLTTGLAGDPQAAPVDSQLPTPESPSGAVIISDSQILEAAAAQSAEMAAGFIRNGNRKAGREHLHQALNQLNEAELE